jgi:methionine-rich copper-binding protein CopC
MFRIPACLFAVLALTPLPAAAHAVLVESAPPVGGTVAAGHVTFTLRYNSRIDRERSVLLLTAPDHGPARIPIAPEGEADSLAAGQDLAPGAYVLRWQVLAIDGHITRGDIPFTVTAKP